MALTKGQTLSIALLFTSLAAAGCTSNVGPRTSYNGQSYGGPGLPPSASRPLPADIPASEARPKHGRAYLGATRHKIEGLEDMSWKERAKCLAKRIDTDHALTYHFDDNRSRLNFDVKDLDDNPRFEFELEITLGPNARNQRAPHKCRFDSPWQGTLGSLYNEVFIRQEDRIGKDFQRLFGSGRKKTSPSPG